MTENIGLVAWYVKCLIATFLDPHKKANSFHASAKAYEALYHNSGIFYRIESQNIDLNVKNLQEKLFVLESKFNELNGNSPAISARAYRIAEEKVNSGKGEVVRDPEDNDE